MSKKEMNEIVEKIRSIDEQIYALMAQREELKASVPDRNKLLDMIMSDGKPHII